MSVVITEQNFDELVLQSNLPVMVDFWATWCAPCVAIAPLIEILDAEYKDRAVIGKLDIDESKTIAERYKIQHFPSFLFFKDGELVEKIKWTVPKSEFVKVLDRLV